VASPLSHSLNPGSAYKIPIAHAEGRYYADQKTLSRLQQNKQIIFQYCDEYGQVNETGNPNGSQLNIAGICNETRNVFGMMPHPERASEEMLGNTDGKLLFDSFISYADALEVDVIDDLLR
jgi:phosphoribosylformylglycinamidine (FGAM) synthase-like amidotransferase family enzyme